MVRHPHVVLDDAAVAGAGAEDVPLPGERAHARRVPGHRANLHEHKRKRRIHRSKDPQVQTHLRQESIGSGHVDKGKGCTCGTHAIVVSYFVYLHHPPATQFGEQHSSASAKRLASHCYDQEPDLLTGQKACRVYANMEQFAKEALRHCNVLIVRTESSQTVQARGSAAIVFAALRTRDMRNQFPGVRPPSWPE